MTATSAVPSSPLAFPADEKELQESIAKLKATAAALPEVLSPLHITAKPNEPVTLYQGDVGINDGKSTIQVSGKVVFEWTPIPAMHLELDQGVSGWQEATASLSNGLTAQIRMPRMPASFPWGRFVVGEFSRPVPARGLDRVIFHCANLPWMSGSMPVRTAQNTFGWGRTLLGKKRVRLTVDAIEGLTGPPGLESQLRDIGGYGLTHVAQVESCDGQPLQPQTVEDILNGASIFLSFAAGRWIPRLFCVGYSQGSVTWENWSVGRMTPWKGVQTWSSPFHPESLASPFDGFMERWLNPVWTESILGAMHWYIAANTQAVGDIDTSLILTQTALELLSWTLFVRERAAFDDAKFDGKNAGAKIQLLLEEAKVPLAIPTACPALAALAKTQNWSNGPYAITSLRNALVHAHRLSQLLGFAPEARSEAWRLSLWYLDLAFLWLFGLDRVYVNRLSHSAVDTELPPWLPPTAGGTQP